MRKPSGSMKRFPSLPPRQVVTQKAPTTDVVPPSVMSPVVQPPVPLELNSNEPSGCYSHKDLALQELDRLCKWSQEVNYLASEEGQALNQDKGPSEHPVRQDGTHLSYTMEELQSWMNSSLLPEQYVVSPELKIMNIGGKKPVELFDTLVLPLSRIFDVKHQFNGLILACIGYDGRPNVFTVSVNEVTRDLRKFASRLASLGVGYYEKEHQPFSRFMNCCSRMCSITPTCLVEQAGFVPEKMVYVSHESVIQRDIGVSETQISYQIRKALPQLTAQGTLLEWQEHVAGPVRQLPTMLFPILAMLSNVLLNLIGEGTVIVHFYGLSSGGKTTRGQLAQSVVGRATDPSKDGRSAIRKWGGTVNWLLAIMKSHHGMGLVLDELGSHSGKDFAATIYAISNGQSKGRCDTEGDVKEDQDSAILCVISTGEVSSHDFLRKQGSSVNSGADVRMLNIGLQQKDAQLPGESLIQTKARIDRLKEACGQFHGTALPALVQGLLNLPGVTSSEALRQLVRGRIQTCAERLLPLVNGASASELVCRGMDYFAMTLATGLYGIELGVLPYTEDEVVAAVVECANRWAAPLKDKPDDVSRAAHALLNRLIRDRQMFPDIDSVKESKHMGFIQGPVFLVRLSWFAELVPQYGEQVVNWLEDHGYLRPGADKRPSVRLRNTSEKTKYKAGVYYALDHDKVMSFSGGIEVEDDHMDTPQESQSPKLSFPRSATSETGSVIAASSQCIPELSEEEIEQF